MVVPKDRGALCLRPASPRHEQLAAEIEKAYNSTPISVVKAIIKGGGAGLQSSSNARTFAPSSLNENGLPIICTPASSRP